MNAVGIYSSGSANFEAKHQYFEIFVHVMWTIENLIILMDRARRVVLGTNS